ncbi:SDR family NAD(P)-dependent oxidoreductase [Paenibacillus athensensis]|uniref:Polysaccharide biosynthesis protein CapD-like domain-containing protein n=1 Tax=Paenibacillus athensensis TaxID=1967502 RepID=A0A4Y8Q5A7_9BACL|nr:SDR family NAD(P)-dependent oxidoreductase [Paenibacillus athensensis]MCD1260834.1 SDR family NAD(P)-dependent oxidoreductase [Paenibacillus athensensis]
MSFFQDKKILIIGGTGTIGVSVLKTILKDRPAVVRILSRDEHKQFHLQQELQSFGNIRYLIGDVRDQARVERAMQDIDYVFHFAAMKHVPSCEYNPFEAVQTNITGTQNVIQASLHAGVKKTIFTSTDKAIAPTNTYGASKLMAERLIIAAQNQTGPKETLFAAVRFGNVMGSRGSVIPLFQWQIENKREITVTDLAMSRFMMSLQQATSLTIGAMKRAQGGEIFVLKMPVIVLRDLAEVVVQETTKKLNINPKDISFREIGLRPGEKMYEELMTDEEAKYALEFSDMFVVTNQFLNNDHQYPDSWRAPHMSYSSQNVLPISRSDLLGLLHSQGLL